MPLASNPKASTDAQQAIHRSTSDHAGRIMTDYWLSKMFFDLQQDPKLAADYRADKAAVIDRYEIKPEVRKALLEDDISVLAPRVNAYLLRFYFQIRGMPEAEFIAKLHALDSHATIAKEKVANG
jgi:hypothetical protein